jgi:chorismate mutase
MKPALRHQIATLDRALLALLNERARLLEELPADFSERGACVEDLLRRNPGPLPATTLRAVFEAIDRGGPRAGERA